MAQFSPSYAHHFEMNASTMYELHDSTCLDPHAFIMPSRRPVLHIETRPRWGTDFRNRQPPDEANAAYRKFQIDCYTSRPPSNDNVKLSPAAKWRRTEQASPELEWGFPPPPFAWLYRLIFHSWWLLLAAMAAMDLDRVADFVYRIWAPRKQRLMQFASCMLPCLLCCLFILVMILHPLSKEETLEYELRHHCEIRAGPFEVGQGLRMR